MTHKLNHINVHGRKDMYNMMHVYLYKEY